MALMNGIGGSRGHNPRGVVIHNGADGQNATTDFYRKWLTTHDPAQGFAHAYVCSDGILIAEDESNKAWHCGNEYGNSEFYSVEVCQSMGDEQVFRQNEDKALRFVAEKFKQWGIQPNARTVCLHRDFSATACPHRSQELHGGADGTRQFFIDKIAEYMAETEPDIVNATVQLNTGADYTRMKIQLAGDGIVRIVSKDGRFLTAASAKANANVDFRKFDCKEYQLWKILNKDYLNATYKMFQSVANPELFLSVEGNGADGKKNLKLYTDLHSMKQKFYIREETDSRSLIIHAFSGKCVSAKD